MKRIISLALAIIMVASMFACFTFTLNVTAGDLPVYGKVDAGYIPKGTAIENAEQFGAMTVNGEYYLKNDITVDATYVSEFKGTLDGNGKTVTATTPLFDNLNGTVKNLTVKATIDESAVTDKSVGALARKAINANIMNTVTADTSLVKGASQNYFITVGTEYHHIATGGLVGEVTGNSIFTKCANYGQVIGECVGGLVGILHDSQSAKAVFNNCFNTGNVSDNSFKHTVLTLKPTGSIYMSMGGIVGMIYEFRTAEFNGCQNSGTLTSRSTHVANGSPTGGIYGYAGYNNSATASYDMHIYVLNCKNEGRIDGGNQSGGITGWAGYADVTFENCSNTGKITAAKGYAGGLMARTTDNGKGSQSARIINCVNGIQGQPTVGTSQSTSGNTGGAVGYIGNGRVYMDGVTNYANVGALKTETQDEVRGVGTCGGIVGSCDGSNTTSDNYFANCINYGTIVAKDRAGGCFGVVPQGTVLNCYNYGDVYSSLESYAGGITSRASHHDAANNTAKTSTTFGKYAVAFINCHNNGNVYSGEDQTGGIVGYSKTYIYMYDCSNNGTVTIAPSEAADGNDCRGGGLIGDSVGGATLENCANNGNVTVTNAVAGGLIGNIGNGSTPNVKDYSYRIVNCINTGSISTGTKATAYAGGIIGYAWSSGASRYMYIVNSVNYGDITSTSQYVGGIFGYSNFSKITIDNCLSAGVLSGSTGAYAIGFNKNATYFTAGVKNCYYTTDIIKSGSTNTYAYTNDAATKSLTDVEATTLSLVSTADLTSGKFAAEHGFYQNLAKSGSLPTPLRSEKAVSLAGTDYVNKYKITFICSDGTPIYVDASANESITLPTVQTNVERATINTASGGDSIAATCDIYKLNDSVAVPFGWKLGDEVLTGSYTVTGDVTFKAADLEVKTAYGASVRLANDSTGIRFSTTVDEKVLEAVIASGKSVTTGTLITPVARVYAAGGFTKEALDNLSGVTNKYLEVVSDAEYRGNGNTADETVYNFVGSVEKILHTETVNNYSVVYAAIGYVCVDGTYYYSDTYTTRSVIAVAAAAINDISNTQSVGYPNAYGAAFSPYTEAQRAIINGFLG